MRMAPFQMIWSRIIEHAGETFFTKTGLKFTYEIVGNRFRARRSNYRIAKNDFEKAYRLIPITGPGEISEIVRGPSYVWGVLHDKRINNGKW